MHIGRSQPSRGPCRGSMSAAILTILLGTLSATSTLEAQACFLRGDTNQDSNTDLSDGVNILLFLFFGGPAPGCMDSADVSDDGEVDIGDAISLFNFLFLGSTAPAAPGPINCGTDPTADDLDCVTHAACDDEPCDAACTSNEDCDDASYCAKATGDCEGEGECTLRPQACPRIFDPVCGCDGETYANACLAAAAGVNVVSEEACEPSVCGTIAGIPCDAGEFCEFPPDTCEVSDNAGVCVTIPLGCPDVWDPVCGCDGVTYGNDCERQAAGAQLAHEGECDAANVCGTIAGIPCDEGEFCQFPPDTCEVADNAGECVAVPLTCPLIFDPVCGCDGRTYGNDCARRAARAQLAHEGECRDEVVCGGIAGVRCPVGEFCELPEGECQIADNQGTCVPIPELCPEIFDPVCGCDGTTYGNDCERLRAGAQKAHDGACEQQGICGGIAGILCDEGQFCEFPPNTCDVVDNAGTCVTIPEACPAIFDPVCGCDGRTYGNDCERRRAGVQLAHAGSCEQEAQ